MGNLGSHHSNIDVEHFRGFALADSVAPFIVINDQDAPAAWSFTLLHELTHIWLGQTGVSGQDATVALETFCNDVATNFLLPADDMAAAGARLQGLASDDLRHEVTALADARYVSSSMVGYRLHRLGFLSREAWQQLSAFYRAQWLAARTAQRERNRERDGGPNYYLVRRLRLGSRLIRVSRRMIEEGVLVPSRPRNPRRPTSQRLRRHCRRRSAASSVGPRGAAPPRFHVLTTASRDYYPIERVPEFWQWLLHMGASDQLKLPVEVVEEVRAGNDDVAPWLAVQRHRRR